MGAVPDVIVNGTQKYEMGVFNRTPFWHRIGAVWTPKDGQESDILALREAIKLANMNDLDYRLEPAFVILNGEAFEMPDRVATTRVNPADRSKRQYVSNVGKQTHLFQVEELGEFAETILEIGAPDGVQVEALFQMGDGKKTVYVFRLPEGINVGTDKIVRYLLVVDVYDGSGSVIVKLVNIRVGCANTLALGLAERTVQITVPHRGLGLKQRIQWARESLGISTKVDPMFEERMNKLLDTFVLEEKFEEIVKAMVPDVPVTSTDRQKNTVIRKRTQIKSVYDGPTIGEFRNTAWGVLNALTEAQQWAPGSQTSALSLAKRQAGVGTTQFENKALATINAVLA